MAEDEVKKNSIWKERLKRHLAILKWIPSYGKSDFVADAIAGFTLGLTLIPQSVAYAALAGVSAEYGLYSSFMGAFVYCFFGTVKEVSVGPTSLISLLTFEFTRDLPIELVFLFTFLCGCVEFLFGLLQLGFLVNFISTPITKSFQSATSIIIIASQLKDFFGVPKYKSGRFLDNVWNAGKRIGQANLWDLLLSGFCCIFLLSLRKVKDLKIMKTKNIEGNKKILKKSIWFISISRNAICVLISCFIAYGFTTEEKALFRLTGNIPSGLPTFRPMPVSLQTGNETMSFAEMVYKISPGLFVVPLISILANVTIAKAFSNGSAVDATQEMLTLGICNMSGALFGSLPTCGAFTRSAVSNSSGVRTPLAGLFTGTLILLVIKYLTPYFYYIPKATLAAVLICAVIYMVDFKTFWHLWRVSKRDFFFAATTFSASLLVGIQLGLSLGIALSIGHLLYMWARPSISVRIKATDKGNYYLVTPDIGFFFPANDFLRSEIIGRCFENIPVVIDCIHFKGIDFTTAQGIEDLANYYKRKERPLALININPNVYSIFKNSKIELSLKRYTAEEEEEKELKHILFEPEESNVTFAILIEKKNSATDLTNSKSKISEEKSLI